MPSQPIGDCIGNSIPRGRMASAMVFVLLLDIFGVKLLPRYSKEQMMKSWVEDDNDDMSLYFWGCLPRN